MYIHVCLFMYVKLEPSFIYLHAYLTNTHLLTYLPADLA